MVDVPAVDKAGARAGTDGAQPQKSDAQKREDRQNALVAAVAAAKAKAAAKAAKPGNTKQDDQAKPEANQAAPGGWSPNHKGWDTAQGTQAPEPSSWERALGCLRAAGGAFQMGAGVFAMANAEVPGVAQAAGAFAIAHGYSDWKAGSSVCLGNKPKPSPFETTVSAGMQAFGVDPKNADSAARKADMAAAFMTPGGGPAAFSGAVRAGSKAPALATSLTARLATKAQGQSLAANATAMAMSAAGGNGGEKAESTAASESKKPGKAEATDNAKTAEGAKATEAKGAAAGDTKHYTVDDILQNPSILSGKAPEEVAKVLGDRPGWKVETLGKGSKAGEGWVHREYLPNGEASGRVIRWHPGGDITERSLIGGFRTG